MHPGKYRPVRGGLRILYLFIRGKERGHTHSEAMLSSLVHAFCQSSVKTLRRTPVCGSQRPDTTHLWFLHPPLFHLRFLFSVYFLFIIAHPAYAVFVLPPFLSCFLFLFSIVSPILPLPSKGLVPFVSPLVPLCVSSFFLRLSFSLHLCFTPTQMNSRAWPPPFCGLRVVRHGWGLYIYFF